MAICFSFSTIYGHMIDPRAKPAEKAAGVIFLHAGVDFILKQCETVIYH